MAERIEHSGIVDRVECDTVHVRITSHSACGSCKAREACGLAEAQEKIASMKIEKLMNEEAPNIDRLEKAVDSSVGLNPRREALERLQQYTNNVRNQVHKIYDAVPEPSDWFKQYNKDQLDILDESVKNYAAYKEEDEKYFQKPLIANGIVLGANNCFMATMGRTRCLLIELGMILIGSFILATFGAR